MFFFRKKIKFPSGQQKTVEAAETWRVSWYSRYGEYFGNTREEVEVFFSEKDAKDFADSLRNAFKLLRHKSLTTVTVKKNNY